MNVLKIKPFLLIAIFAMTIITACEDDDDDKKPVESTKLKIEFNLTSGGEQVSLNEITTLPNGYDLMVSVFKTYFTDVKLVDNFGNELLIQELALLNIGAENENYVETEISEAGSYTLLSFGIGLTPKVNDSDPGSFERAHPLSTYQNMYWNMLKYRFIKFEGIADSTGKLQSGADFPLAYHTGTDPLYTVATIKGNFSVNTSNDNIIQVDVNLDELFASQENPIDFATENQTHSEPVDIHVAYKFTANMIKALSASQN